jgi:acyl-CoA thioesterase-1
MYPLRFAASRFAPAVLALVALVVAAGCGTPAPQQAQPGLAADPEITEPGQLPSSNRVAIVVLGDSLTAGLGLVTEEAFPARLQDLFWNEGYGEVEIVDAGVSGDTTAGGLRRVGGLLEPRNVRILVIALGGNDALRGLSVTQTRQNLAGIIEAALGSGVDVLLTGMEGPTNLGEDYRASFRGVFTALAAEYKGRISFVPFLLEGVAGNPSLNQSDGLHPNARGAQLIAEHLYQPLQNMVADLPAAP